MWERNERSMVQSETTDQEAAAKIYLRQKLDSSNEKRHNSAEALE